MNIIFAGSKGKTGSVVFNYLKEKGYNINNEINLNEKKLINVIKPNSIIIDFTNKEVALKHASICLENNCHFICGTTGLTDEQINDFSKQANKKKLIFVFCPNFSIGIPLILPFISTLSKEFENIKIIESHHISKKDTPSGTALLLKKYLNESVPIESIRTTYQSLDHTITFQNDYEEITLTHKATNKLAYAKGVEKALKKAINNIAFNKSINQKNNFPQ